MLQTCTRCRNRRIKCDSLLPACASCAKSDVECTFHDAALDEDIPRSYVKALNDRIQELTSQLALLPQTPSTTGSPTAASCTASSVSYVLMPGPRQDVYLNHSFPSRVTQVVFEVLSQSHTMPSAPFSAGTGDDHFTPPDLVLDRSILTPSAVRFLLARYNRCIRPQYDILPTELLTHDGLSLKKLRGVQKFEILMACAIAAARESYRTPSWTIYAQVCRDWAGELLPPILSAADGDSLTCMLLLLLYELAEPSRGLLWELLDVSVRTCLQLGWHRPSGPAAMAAAAAATVVSPVAASEHSNSVVSDEGACSAESIGLLSALNSIKGSLQTVFHRPDLLSGFDLPIPSDSGIVVQTYLELSRAIYDSGRLYDNQGCPFVGDVAVCMERIENVASAPMAIIHETWLLFLPVCVRHRQCFHCFQEVDDRSGRGMQSLRQRVVDAATHLLETIYAVAKAADGFIPPMLASTRAFVAGCTIATSIAKQWTTPQQHFRHLVRCTEILALFASHWEGGHNYLQVWRTIVDAVG